tara:strand:+ start:46290 stop:46652 length:363 start_codon:yes stop_codon:yes gene_type:complete
MNHDKLTHNLEILLRLFDDRPKHLIKYLIDNNCLTDKFIDLVLNSDKLNNKLGDGKLDFSDYDEMYFYFNNLIDNNHTKSNDVLEKELNIQLFDLLSKEKYEDASRLRDYMINKNVKILI